MTIRHDPAMLNPGIRYLRLGYLTTFETGQTLTVGDRIGGDKRGAKLTPAYYTLLNSLDLTVGDRDFTAGELGLLGWLAGQGLILLLPGDAGIDDLTVVPVPRRPLAFVGDLDEGYLIRAGDEDPFPVSTLGARFLPLFDGERTLAEIARALEAEGLADQEVLMEEALVLLRDFTRSGAITFEPTAP